MTFSLTPPCAVVLRSVVPRSWPGGGAETKATNVLPPIKNPRYLARAWRVKVSMAPGRYSSGLVTLEFINDQGARVSLERVYVIGSYWRASVRRPTGNYPQLELLNCLKDLDTQSVEILCIEVDELRDDEALGRLGSVKTLILSYAAAKLCFLALERDASTVKHAQGLP